VKRLAVGLVVVLVLFVVADFAVRAVAENAAAEMIDEQIRQKVEPDVSLGGFPFLLSLLRGSFDEITVDIDSTSEGPVEVEDIHLKLTGVDLEALEVLGGRGNLRARSLRGRGVISEATLNEIASADLGGARIELEDNRVLVSRGEMSVPANAVVAGNRLLVNAGEAFGPVEIPLPAPLPEVRFTSLRAENNRLVLGVMASRVRFRA